MSYSTSSMVENFTDLLPPKSSIITPIVIRRSLTFNNSELYELYAISESAIHRGISFQTLFKGTLGNYGITRFLSNQNYIEPPIYMFQTQHETGKDWSTLFQTCEMIMDPAEQIQARKALILVVSVSSALQKKGIVDNMTALIEAAEMKNYTFGEFGGKPIDSCGKFKDHLLECKAGGNTSYLDIFIVVVFLLLFLAIAGTKMLNCI